MIFGWLRARKRRRWLSAPLPGEWEAYIAREFVHWRWLTAPERARISGLTHALVQMKSWEGCDGLTLTDPMKALIAAQAALLLLGLPQDHFGNVHTVLVYPGRYVLPGAGVTPDGQIHGDRTVLGHASPQGPVVLSWPDVVAGARDGTDGRNLVIHEFAHKLDMLDGMVDGTPPIHCSRELQRWIDAMTPVYEGLQRDVRRGRKTFLDPYAATNVAEFFAVASEYFFERPETLRRTHTEVYRALAGFYRQDTAERARASLAQRTTARGVGGKERARRAKRR